MIFNLILRYNHTFNKINYMIYFLFANGPDFNKL